MVAALTLLVATISSFGADALGLDEIMQQSPLGSPLRAVIPVIANARDDASAIGLFDECFKLVRSQGTTGADLPQLQNGQMSVVHTDTGMLLLISTDRPVEEPVLSVTVEAGCPTTVRRQYTLFLDPPKIQAPLVEREIPRNVDPTADYFTPERIAASAAFDERNRGSVNRRLVARVSGAESRQAVHRAAGVVNDNIEAPTAALMRPAPQLTVSRTAGTVAKDPERAISMALNAHAPATSQEVEVESVVLQRRVAELSTIVLQMRQELQAAQAARHAAELAAKASPLAVLERWAVTDSRLLAALLVVVALLMAMKLAVSHRPRYVKEYTASDIEMMMGPITLTRDGPRTVYPTMTRPESGLAAGTTKQAWAGKDDLELAFDEELLTGRRQNATTTVHTARQAVDARPIAVAASILDYAHDVEKRAASAVTKPRPQSPAPLSLVPQPATAEAQIPTSDDPWRLDFTLGIPHPAEGGSRYFHRR